MRTDTLRLANREETIVPGTAVIIEAAINGGTPKSRNVSVPRTPAEVTTDALRCLEAGAAIVHNHTDDPVLGGSGRHDSRPYVDAWSPILERWPDALLYPTMAGGGPHTSDEERYQHVIALADGGLLRVGLVDPGSVNLGTAVYENSPAYTRYTMDVCRERRLGPSLSIFEPGFLRSVLAYHDAGTLPPGAMVKLYFGGPNAAFGLPPSAASLDAYLAMLNGTGLPWLVAVLGGDVFEGGFARLALERGGNVRVGLEDYAGPGQPTNVELVGRAAALAKESGRSVANCAEAAAILGLPG